MSKTGSIKSAEQEGFQVLLDFHLSAMTMAEATALLANKGLNPDDMLWATEIMRVQCVEPGDDQESSKVEAHLRERIAFYGVASLDVAHSSPSTTPSVQRVSIRRSKLDEDEVSHRNDSRHSRIASLSLSSPLLDNAASSSSSTRAVIRVSSPAVSALLGPYSIT